MEGNVTEDTTARLEDDFGFFVSREWILGAKIPDGEMQTGTVADIGRIVKAIVKKRCAKIWTPPLIHDNMCWEVSKWPHLMIS